MNFSRVSLVFSILILVYIVTDILVLVAVALEKSNLANIREMQHKDQFGNAISMLDLSLSLSLYFIILYLSI